MTPNFRERLVCAGCILNSRQRFILTKARQLSNRFSSRPDIYLHERTTTLYAQAANKLKARVIGSEYLGEDITPGKLINGVRHEDVARLSFSNARFDLVISNDVFEHVPDYVRAFSDNFRVLKSGGSLLFSIPFNATKSSTVSRAHITKGKIKYLATPVFHGNPIDDKGSLVFHDFGWDILQTCRRVGFKDAYVIIYNGPWYGYFGATGQFIFIALK